MRDLGAEAYESYSRMCEGLGHPIMSREAYEKATANIPSVPNNTDAILRNNNPKKDK